MSKGDSKSQTKDTELTCEVNGLNTTGLTKEAQSKVNTSDLHNLGTSKEMTLAET